MRSAGRLGGIVLNETAEIVTAGPIATTTPRHLLKPLAKRLDVDLIGTRWKSEDGVYTLTSATDGTTRVWTKGAPNAPVVLPGGPVPDAPDRPAGAGGRGPTCRR